MQVIVLLDIMTLLRILRLLKNIQKWKAILTIFIRIAPAMFKVVCAYFYEHA